jgi:hypothetical protein
VNLAKVIHAVQVAGQLAPVFLVVIDAEESCSETCQTFYNLYRYFSIFLTNLLQIDNEPVVGGGDVLDDHRRLGEPSVGCQIGEIVLSSVGHRQGHNPLLVEGRFIVGETQKSFLWSKRETNNVKLIT